MGERSGERGRLLHRGGAVPSPPQGLSARPPGPNGGPLLQGAAGGARQGPAAPPAAEGESLQFEEISAAAFMIQNAVQRTPCMYSRLSKYYGSEIFVKKEFLHATGSAKERGVRYCLQMMTKDQRARGVVAVGAWSSAHALAVSHHAAEMRVPARVLVAARAPEALLRACRDLGANAGRARVGSGEGGGGEGARGARAHALQVAREEGSALLEDDDHPNMIAGMGTLGLEVMEQVPGVEAVIIPAGGRGSLLAGAAAAIKHLDPAVTIVGVELASCPSWQRALTMGQPTQSDSGKENRLCEDLSSQSVGPNAFATGRHVIDKVVSITEQDLLLAMLKVLEFEGAAVNADGAAALAAIVSGKLPELRGKRVVVVLVSGSIDVSHFKRCVDRALVLDGRLCKFSVRVSDSPAEQGRLLELLGREEARLMDISLDRTFLTTDLFSVQVTCVVETRDHVHAAQLKGVLAEKYAALTWHDK
ncbi:L-threonine ammonia-lyase-like [Petromyzon marinus]|uniref:L-threonine ammonia-lyase-like n=1 Tax=Petromyzon marinus TaxID=7757 RepID=UPI003F6ECF4B